MTERYGERRDTPATEPAPVITSKARTATWVVTGQNSAQAGGTTELFARSTDAPSPTVTGTTGRWSYERRQGRNSDTGGARRMSPLRPDSEPAPTIASAGLATGRDRWVYVNGNQENAARRPASAPAPAPTVHFANALNDVKWVHERPATTIVGSFSPDKVSAPGHHDRGPGADSRQNHAEAVTVTVTEAAVLQSFRPDYPWQGSRTAQFTQIGNAVPPLMARAVISALLETRKKAAA